MTGWKTKLLQHNATPWSALKFRFINGHLELTSSHKSSIKIRGYKSLIGGGKKFKNIFIHGVAFTSCLHAYLSAQWRNSRSLRAASVNTSSCFCLTKLKDERPGRVDSCVSTLSFFFFCCRTRSFIDVEYWWSQISRSTVQQFMAKRVSCRDRRDTLREQRLCSSAACVCLRNGIWNRSHSP